MSGLNGEVLQIFIIYWLNIGSLLLLSRSKEKLFLLKLERADSYRVRIVVGKELVILQKI